MGSSERAAPNKSFVAGFSGVCGDWLLFVKVSGLTTSDEVRESFFSSRAETSVSLLNGVPLGVLFPNEFDRNELWLLFDDSECLGPVIPERIEAERLILFFLSASYSSSGTSTLINP